MSLKKIPKTQLPELNVCDETKWARVVKFYAVTQEITNLENGNWGIMPEPVLHKYIQHIRMVNTRNSFYARRDYTDDLQSIRALTAEAIGAHTDEIVFTRNATEAMQSLIGGYSRLSKGETIIYADLDYDSMQSTMDWLAQRTEATVKKIAISEPASLTSILDDYERAFRTGNNCRLVLLTHLSHRTGLIIPVKQISDLARSLGIDVIVDAAHSWGQIDFTIKDIGADFIGFNLHKWIGAPLGVGFMYVRRGCAWKISPAYNESSFPMDDPRNLVHMGTSSFSAILTVPQALQFHNYIGAKNKARRLKYLRDLWVKQVRGNLPIDILTPDGTGSAGMTSFRLSHHPKLGAHEQFARKLVEKHKIFTVHRDGVKRGDCIRVTPALYTTSDDINRFVEALRNELA